MTTLRDRFVAFWTDDLPPLSGPLRFLFYGGLLFVCWFNFANPVRGIVPYEATDPRTYRTYGLIEAIGVPYLSPDLVRGLITLTVAVWIFAAVGFLGRLSRVVTAIGIVCLHGLFLGTNSLNHNWFLPMYACVALCFARTNDRWSVDAFLKKLRRGSSSETPGPRTLADTGFARKLVLVLAAGFYFSSGLTKLLTSGWRWIDGHTITYMARQRGGRYPLTNFLAEHLEVMGPLSALTLALEVGAILLLVSRRFRWVWVAGIVSFHVGIRVTLGPAYWESVLVLMLVLDWRSLLHRIRGTGISIPPWLASMVGEAPAATAGRSPVRGAFAGAVAGTLVLVGILGVAVFQVFWWPATNVYMYSSYYSIPRDIRANHPRSSYERPASAQRIARGLLEPRTSMDAKEYMLAQARVRLTARGSPPLDLTDHLGVYRWKQWWLTVGGPVLIRDLAAKPTGRIELDPANPDQPAQRFLTGFVEVLRDHLPPEVASEYERVEMTYPLEAGEAVIAAVRLSPDGDRPTARPPE